MDEDYVLHYPSDACLELLRNYEEFKNYIKSDDYREDSAKHVQYGDQPSLLCFISYDVNVALEPAYEYKLMKKLLKYSNFSVIDRVSLYGLSLISRYLIRMTIFIDKSSRKNAIYYYTKIVRELVSHGVEPDNRICARICENMMNGINVDFLNTIVHTGVDVNVPIQYDYADYWTTFANWMCEHRTFEPFAARVEYQKFIEAGADPRCERGLFLFTSMISRDNVESAMMMDVMIAAI